MAQYQAKQRTYVEGCYLEGGQTIILSPAASHRMKGNKNLDLIGPADQEPKKGEVLAESDPIVGRTEPPVKLLQPGGPK